MAHFPRICQLLGLLLCMYLLWPASAQACSCSTPDLDESVRNADLVFHGRVLEAGDVMSTGFWVSRKSRFEVLALYKGAAGRTVTVDTSYAGGSCGYPFVAGREYLVFAYDNGGWRPGPDYETDICTRTTPLPEAAEDLRALGVPLPRKRRASEYELAAMATVVVLVVAGIGWRLRRSGGAPPAA